MTQAVCILGVTGSIGQSTLKVLEQNPDQYNVFAVSAYSRLDELLKICKQHRPKVVVVPNEKALELKQLFNQENLINIEILTDQSGLIAIAEHNDVDIVMAAIVGAAGLLPTLAAVKAGKRVLLANKESLVMSGDITGYDYFGMVWGLEPLTVFYDWLYVNALKQNTHLHEEVLQYQAFSDISFNPKKNIHCPAYSLAMFVALHKRELLEGIEDPGTFFDLVTGFELSNTEHLLQEGWF